MVKELVGPNGLAWDIKVIMVIQGFKLVVEEVFHTVPERGLDISLDFGIAFVALEELSVK